MKNIWEHTCPCGNGKDTTYRITPFSAATLVWDPAKEIIFTTLRDKDKNVCETCYTLDQAFFDIIVRSYRVYQTIGYGLRTR